VAAALAIVVIAGFIIHRLRQLRSERTLNS
jgi:hypothetical protein